VPTIIYDICTKLSAHILQYASKITSYFRVRW